MCIAIAKPKNHFISKETLQICWNSNPHGAGFCYVGALDGLIHIEKFMDFKSFYDRFNIVDTVLGSTSDMLIHFRITSRGATRLDNCHPFQINDKMAFIHNGTINSMPVDKEHQHSDTYIFNELILKKLPEGWEDNEGIKYLIEDVIGWSKVAVLHADKGFTIYNEEKGEWHEGCWYSNSSYKRTTYVYTGSASNYYSKQGTLDWDEDDWDGSRYYKNKHKKEEVKQLPAKVVEIPVQTKSSQEELLIIEQELTKIKEQIVPDIMGNKPVFRCSYCNSYFDQDYIAFIDDKVGSIEFVCGDCLEDFTKWDLEVTEITNPDPDEIMDVLAEQIIDYGYPKYEKTV